MNFSRRVHYAVCVCLAIAGSQYCSSARAQEVLPTGMSITPTATQGSVFEPLNPDLPSLPRFTVDHPVSTAVSPDGETLLILTSGYNSNFDESGNQIAGLSDEYIFVYDISPQTLLRTHGAPLKKQVLHVPNAFVGLAWNPDGKHFYASGGVNDNVYIFQICAKRWEPVGRPLNLGHAAGLGVEVRPMVAGLAVNDKGNLLLVANYENDSVSLIDLSTNLKIKEFDLRPGKIDPSLKGVAGGEFPYWVAFKEDGHKAYVSSLRDREIVVLDVLSKRPFVRLHTSPTLPSGRIKLSGQPNRLLLNSSQNLLFAAADNSDSVDIIDTNTDRPIFSVKTTAPDAVFPNKRNFKGSNPNSLALSADEKTLYVTNGGTNSVAVIKLATALKDSHVEGLIPTGWYPESISVSRDGSRLYIVNGKGNAGPNEGCRVSLVTGDDCESGNQYIPQLMKGGFLSMPTPKDDELVRLTKLVAQNNHFSDPSVSPAIFSLLREKIKHVIYIVKENRTYDQVLGDLEKGNGDPYITQFPESITPNHHALARQFVTLDMFFDSGEVSGSGWNWSTAARGTDNLEKTIPLKYADRGFSYDFESANRGINIGDGTLENRKKIDPDTKILDAEDQLPGTADVNAPDGPQDTDGTGYLWNSALNVMSKSAVRNYGFFLTSHSPKAISDKEILPSCRGLKDQEPQSFAANRSLQDITDSRFPGFDQRIPDYWRFLEWEREFDTYTKGNEDSLPRLELIRLPHDHFGKFDEALCGVNTPERQIADNDYALGLIVDKVGHSRYAKDTLIFVVEDDAQNGPDHIDAHRSLAYVIGPYVRRNALISHRYNTVSMLRTIEEVLGIEALGLNDALQEPMTEVFSSEEALSQWSYVLKDSQVPVPQILCDTKLPVPQATCARATRLFRPGHDAAYWQEQTKGLDFSTEDKVDSALFNEILWKGLMGNRKPYPSERNGRDLRQGRDGLLKRFVQNATDQAP